MESYFIKYCKQRVHIKKKNLLFAITGDTGSGKSYAGLKLGEVIDPNFSIKNVCFNPDQFLERIVDPSLKIGSVLILDEAGVANDNRRWYSEPNLVINHTLQTFRYKRLICFFCVRFLGFLDSKTRPMLHGKMKTVGLDQKNKINSLVPLIFQVSEEGKIYTKYLILRTPEGMKVIKNIKLTMPSNELVKQYEQAVTTYKDEVQAISHRALIAHRRKNDKVLPKRQQQVYDMLKMGASKQDISDLLGIDYRVVNTHCKAVREKGWDIEG
jgi:DNA-binding CsgD family transcriptional regulator